MPTLDQPWSQADYDDAYELDGELDGHPSTRPGVTLGYHRYSVIPVLDKRMRYLLPQLNLRSSDGVILVGAGFGWGSECLQGQVPAACLGTDTSRFIHGAKSQTEEADLRRRIALTGLDPSRGRGSELLGRFWDGGVRTRSILTDEPLGDESSRRRTLDKLGQTPAWVISEDVLACLSDNGAINLARRMDALNPTGGVIHTIALAQLPDDDAIMPQDPGYNWKRPGAWRALFDANGLSSHLLIESVIAKQEFF